MTRTNFFLAALLAVAVSVLFFTPPETSSSGAQARFFKNVDENRTMAGVLMRGQMRPGYGAAVSVVEVGPALQPVTGDTISVWVQHYRPGKRRQEARLLRKSEAHDLLVYCYPQSVADGVRTDHVLPKSDSLTYVYPLSGSEYAVVSGRQSDPLAFLSAHNIEQQYEGL